MTELSKLISFFHQGQSAYGLIKGNGVVNLSRVHGAKWPTLHHVVEAGVLQELCAAGVALTPDYALAGIKFDIPITNPEKLIGVGINFPDRNEEYKDCQEAPKNMSLFISFPRSFVGHGEALVRPPESPQLDYEGEIVIITGKGGRRIPNLLRYAISRRYRCATKVPSATGCAVRSLMSHRARILITRVPSVLGWFPTRTKASSPTFP